MEPAPTTSTSKVEFSGRSVRQQLLLAFGGTVGAFFILLVGLCAAIIFSLSELVIHESRSALTEQNDSGCSRRPCLPYLGGAEVAFHALHTCCHVDAVQEST